MMGHLEPGQERLFYDFRLEDQIPSTHFVRKLDAVLDFKSIRTQLAPFYSEMGRPSVDPGTDDPDVADWLLLRDPLGTPAVRRGSL